MVSTGPSTGRAVPAGVRKPIATATIDAIIADSITSANCQPPFTIKICVIGTRANWPNDPKLVTSPMASERFSGGAARATAPIAIEMPALPSPSPTRIWPINTPVSVTKDAIKNNPPAYSKAPIAATRHGPYRSAAAPKNGEDSPQTRFCTAMASENS